MDAKLESLLLQAQGAAALAEGDNAASHKFLCQACCLDPGTAAEDLFCFHLAARNYQQAECVLKNFQSAIEPAQFKTLSAVLAAQAHDRSPKQEDLAALQPASEAIWPLLYLGILQHAQGETAAARATLFKFVDRLAWRKDTRRSLAVAILLQQESRRCGLCRVRKPTTYVQNGWQLCPQCSRLPEDPRVERLANWFLRRSLDKESKKTQTHFVPILAPSQIVAVLDDEAKQVWERARQIARERGRTTVGLGELGVALCEGPFNRSFFSYPRDQHRLLRDASALEEEISTGSEQVGKELAWLLNVAHWYRRLSRGSPQFEDRRHQPINVQLLKAAYTVCRPGPASLLGSSLALVTGFNLSVAQAELFEYLLRKRPHCLFLRIALSSHHRRVWQRNGKEIEHELWLIRAYPFAARTHEHWLSSEPSKHRVCVDAWVAAVRSNIDDPDSLGQAASFFMWEHPRLAKALVDRCRRLEPKHRAWTGVAIECLDRLLEAASGPAEQRALAREFLDVLETALAHPPGCYTRFSLQDLIARHALNAQAFDRARQAAHSVLAKSAKGQEAYSAKHEAQSVLGVLALRDGDVEKAKEHLFGSLSFPPGKRSEAPIWRLTRVLWQMGEREALARYLAQCRSKWAESEMEAWLTDMKANLPGFSDWADQQPPRPKRQTKSASL
jgi:hypothetical protein